MAYSLKEYIKGIIPDFLLRRMTGIFYGWHGNYSTWDEARRKCTGYATTEILSKVSDASLLVRDGRKPYERDSVVYDNITYSIAVLSGFLLAAARKKDIINVIDFGGALGSSYFQNRRFIEHLEGVNWCIVEQEGFAAAGRKDFSTEKLRFFSSLEECVNLFSPDVFIFSSVLQYLEDPYHILKEAIDLRPDMIIIDRTPFIQKPDRITIHKVHPAIYKAKYPCWFFNERDFLNFFNGRYHLIEEFESLDKANIESEFKGYIFVRND